jgi:hypothetical protein
MKELANMWKEEVAALFKALSRHVPQGTEEKHKKPQLG